MDSHKVANDYRLSQWAQVMQERQNSGQSIKEFCEAGGISRNAYFYWQKKLREAVCTELVITSKQKRGVPGGWMQLGSEPKQCIKEGLDIEISGCRIAVTNNTDHGLLKKVCLTLRDL